jgi:hypothetical protein
MASPASRVRGRLAPHTDRSSRSVLQAPMLLRATGDTRHSAVAYGPLVGGPASFAAFARRYGGVGSAGSAHQINEEAHRLGAQTGCSTVIAKYLYEAFNGRGCAATPVLANPRRSGGDARTLAR